MSEGAALLVDRRLPPVGYRQWVLSFAGSMAVRVETSPAEPVRLRFDDARDAMTMTQKEYWLPPRIPVITVPGCVMEDTTVLLVGMNEELLRAWTWSLVDAGASVRRVRHERLAEPHNTIHGVEVAVIDGCDVSKTDLLDDIAKLRACGGDARVVVATDDLDTMAIPSLTCLLPPLSGERLVAALRERSGPLHRRSWFAQLDVAIAEVLGGASPPLSPQMRVATIMCALDMSDNEMSDVLGVVERTVQDYAKQGRVRLRWRSRRDILRHLAAALGWPLVTLLTRVLGDENLARRIARVVEPPPVTFDISRMTLRI